MEIGSIAAKEVPLARRWSARAHRVSRGTIRKPPPTPRRPLARPASEPIAALIRKSDGCCLSIGCSREAADVEVDDLLIFEQIFAGALESILTEHEDAYAHWAWRRVSRVFCCA
jgi:hypothetical protein